MVITDEAARDGGETAPIGGKAAGLVRLMRAGVQVPGFFVLPPDEPIEDAVGAWSTSGWLRCAVRSSAIGEDGDKHSFAGMYETVLGVRTPDELRAAIARCRQSADSERVRAYLAENNLQPTAVAVIIQELVVGEASGVVFSSDPMDPDRALISSSWGLGEGVVSGAAPADTFRVDRQGTVEAWVIAKDVMVAMPDAAVEATEQPVPTAQQREPSLSEQTAAKLAGVARRLEAALGVPQDIEWTLKDGELVILQTRPITQPIPRGRRLLWDNSNIIESYCGLTGPLTYSFASHAYTIVYQLFCEVMGVERDVIREHSGIFPRMIGLVRGRIYYNLNAWYKIVALLPGYRWNRHFLEQMMGVSEVASDEDAGGDTRMSRLMALPKLLRMMGGLAWRSYRLDADIRRFKATFEDAIGRYQGRALDDKSPFELLEIYGELERRLLWAWSTPIVNDFFVMIFHGLLRSLSEKWIPGEGDLHNALLAGEGGIISTAPATEALKLANRVRTDAAMAELFLSGAPEAELLAAVRSHARIGPAFDAYIDRLGDRVADELKLEVETYRHRPELLIRTLRSYLEGDLARMVKADSADLSVRSQAEAKVEVALEGWRKLVFGRVLRSARRRVADRENLRFLRTRIFATVREIFRALGGQMATAGVLSARDDIFWITVDEAFGWVRGTAVTTDLQALADLRRAEYARFAREPAPADRFYTWGPVWAHNGFLGRPTPMSETEGDGIVGLAACPGLVEGTARLITDPRTETLGENEIMVAYRTDPGWTPLFPKARAILVERGSLLSHSAVVAREMGIPTIVGIPDLMNRLKTGDRIRVDATAGRVTLLGAPEGEE
ncbi:MAG: phosphohistidine swiveling domain-containing protein [Myxococcota bacterium]|jgi:phosphohistidine swiveling domain-containing protein